MNRIDRLVGLITTLQSKKFVTAEFLATKFTISIRTVYRDIKALNEIGVPVGFEPHKGYFIVEGYFLPPVSFSEEEANALVLMEVLAEKFGDISIQKNYELALRKIKAVMKPTQKTKLEQLQEQMRLYRSPSELPSSAYLISIQHSITNKTILQIQYKNLKEEESNRKIEPIGLTFYALDWHIIAWCWLRKNYRDFKLARISGLQKTHQVFQKNQHLTLLQYIQSIQ